MKLGIILTASLLIGCAQPFVANAQNFQLFWRGTYFTTNPDGSITSGSFTEQSFVNKVARDNGLDPSQLVFVYRADKRDTAVVWASSGQFVADVIQMVAGDSKSGYTDIGDPNQGLIVRQAFLYDENHQSPIGSIVAGERPLRDANGNLVRDSFSGIFQFAYPELHAIYYGTFSTGQRVGP